MNTTTYSAPCSRLAGAGRHDSVAGAERYRPGPRRAPSARKSRPIRPAPSKWSTSRATIEISGWDQPTVDVTGTIGEQGRACRCYQQRQSHHRARGAAVGKQLGSDGDSSAHLKIRVPQKSELEVSLVSSDLRVSGVTGNQHLQTVSGDIAGDVGGDLQISTVSGDVHLATHNSHNTQFKTVSGDVSITGADGTMQVNYGQRRYPGDAGHAIARALRKRVRRRQRYRGGACCLGPVRGHFGQR